MLEGGNILRAAVLGNMCPTSRMPRILNQNNPFLLFLLFSRRMGGKEEMDYFDLIF